MLNIGAGEIALILIVALLVLGPQRLPELARGLGKFLSEFRRQTDEVRNVVEREFYKMDQEVQKVVSLEPGETLGPPKTGAAVAQLRDGQSMAPLAAAPALGDAPPDATSVDEAFEPQPEYDPSYCHDPTCHDSSHKHLPTHPDLEAEAAKHAEAFSDDQTQAAAVPLTRTEPGEDEPHTHPDLPSVPAPGTKGQRKSRPS